MPLPYVTTVAGEVVIWSSYLLSDEFEKMDPAAVKHSLIAAAYDARNARESS